MTTRTSARRIGFLMMTIAVVATACAATETVTINDAAITSATSTALRNTPDPTEVPEVSDDTATPRVAGGGDPGCTFESVDDFGDIQIELAFTNRLTEQDDAMAAYEVYDGNGELLVATTRFFEELVPGEDVRIAVDTLTDEPTDRVARVGITCALLEIEADPFGFDKFSPGPADNCIFREVDGFGDVQVQLNVVSPLSETSELAIDYALRGRDGVRFGDGVNFTDSVAPGQPSSTETDTFTDMPDWVNESTFTCEILSIQGF